MFGAELAMYTIGETTFMSDDHYLISQLIGKGRQAI